MECETCRRIAGDDFWIHVAQTKYSIAGLSNFQRARGALIVAPKRHSYAVSELSDEEATDLYRFIRRLMGILTSVFQPDGVNVWQTGHRMLGPGGDHVHTHICPRFVDVPYSFATSEHLKKPTIEERTATADLIKKFVPADIAV